MDAHFRAPGDFWVLPSFQPHDYSLLPGSLRSWFLISTVPLTLLKSHLQPFNPLLGTGQYELFPPWVEDFFWGGQLEHGLLNWIKIGWSIETKLQFLLLVGSRVSGFHSAQALQNSGVFMRRPPLEPWASFWQWKSQEHVAFSSLE